MIVCMCIWEQERNKGEKNWWEHQAISQMPCLPQTEQQATPLLKLPKAVMASNECVTFKTEGKR